jgi:hypothetical protein
LSRPLCAASNSESCGAGAARSELKWCVSSGRQIPTSEQRVHLGESTSGGGMCSDAAVSHARSIVSSTLRLAVSQIGIGGSLAAPPLPHHRTCGSAYGGSAG